MRAGRDPQPADDGDRDVVQVSDEHIAGWMMLEMNCAPKLRLVELVVLSLGTSPRPLAGGRTTLRSRGR